MKYLNVNNLLLEPIIVSMRVVLFGSRAPGGSPHEDSDFDLALVVPNDISKPAVIEYFSHMCPSATIDSFPDYGSNPRPLHLLVMHESEYLNPVHALSSNVRQGVSLVS